jgi:hypothetical protein
MYAKIQQKIHLTFPLVYLNLNQIIVRRFVQTVNMPDMVEPSWEQDKPLSSALLAHGVDVMLVTHFMGQSTEVIDQCDVITSLSKLIHLIQ